MDKVALMFHDRLRLFRPDGDYAILTACADDALTSSIRETGAALDDEADAPAAPKKRSKIKLALLACVPLMLLSGSYAGWTLYLAPMLFNEAAHGATAASKAGDPWPRTP